MATMTKTRTTKISLASVKRAMARATRHSDDWQAECCEIARMAPVARILRRLNPRANDLRVEFHPGRPHIGYTPEQNGRIGDWSEFAGYVLHLSRLGDCEMKWNAVRSDWYGHSPSSAWNGLGRECYGPRLIEALRMVALGYECSRADLDRYGVVLTD